MQISPPVPGIQKGGLSSSAPSLRSSQPFAHRGSPLNWSSIFIAVCGGLFVLCVLLRLNGSSSGLWGKDLGILNESTGVIAGVARPTRSDEWLIWTPAALAQLHHLPPMPVENPAVCRENSGNICIFPGLRSADAVRRTRVDVVAHLFRGRNVGPALDALPLCSRRA